MASMSISFRISEKTINSRSYEDRYNTLTEAVVKAASGKYWAEPTSFIAILTEHDIDEIAARCKRAIAPSADLVLILDNDKKSARLIGQSDDADIHTILPYVQNF